MRKAIIYGLLCFFVQNVSAQINKSRLAAEYDSLTKNTSYGNNDRAGKFYDIRGFKMYCETYGKGAPLLLIHGNGASISAFVKQIPYFSKQYKVIVADSRAQGRSADKTDSLSYEMMADDYAALLTAMHIDSAYVIGWSDGGVNGLLLAVRHPEKVKKLVITGANLRPDSTAVSANILARVTKTHDMFVKMFSDPKPKTALDSTVCKYFRLLAEQPHIPLTDLQKISIPTLVIGGDHDVIRPEHTLEIFQHIPNANLWIIPDAGHYTPVVYTEDFNKKANDFFRYPFIKMEGRDNEF